MGVRRGQWNEPRDVAIYLCRRECGSTLKWIAALLWFPAYTTVGLACGRVESRLENDRSFRQRVDGLLRMLPG
ncbi:MAG: hypothetical protein O6929_08005 [candidate division NC10 bacterium]|nr:hypothetical protein [candidate division NC10 bacterium]